MRLGPTTDLIALPDSASASTAGDPNAHYVRLLLRGLARPAARVARMTRPQLPPCSVSGCDRVAGAVVDGALLCGEHAVVAMQRRKIAMKRDVG